jgi:hypothetical protein
MDIKESLNVDFEINLPEELISSKMIHSAGIFHEYFRLTERRDFVNSITRTITDSTHSFPGSGILYSGMSTKSVMKECFRKSFCSLRIFPKTLPSVIFHGTPP